MQAIYCHTLNDDGSVAWRTVAADYEAGANEYLSAGAPASPAELAAGLPGYAAADLAALKRRLKDAVDAAAERLRLTMITPGAGQAMEYLDVYAEAVQVDAALKPNGGATLDPAQYPMLSASIGCAIDPRTGEPTVDLAGEARAVLWAYDTYQRAGAAIRRARLAGKSAIDAAPTVEAANAAYAGIVWPQLA